jgi:glutathione peroxidase
MASIYDIEINSINGEPLDLNKFKGKKMLIVNTASECGFTPQYAQLQELYDLHKEHIVIIGCPCNDFGAQEPGDLKEIHRFCSLNYNVNFPMTQKVNILNDPHPLYLWLLKKDKNQVSNNEVEWNFHKFLIDENGNLLKSLAASVSPFSDEILDLLN